MEAVTNRLRDLQKAVDDARHKINEVQRKQDDILNHLQQLEDEIKETE